MHQTSLSGCCKRETFLVQMYNKLNKKALSKGNKVFGFNFSSWGKIFLYLILRRELLSEIRPAYVTAWSAIDLKMNFLRINRETNQKMNKIALFSVCRELRGNCILCFVSLVNLRRKKWTRQREMFYLISIPRPLWIRG